MPSRSDPVGPPETVVAAPLAASRLLGSGLVVSLAVFAVNASNFVFQVGTGRLMSSAEYGLLLAAFTLLGLISVASSAIMTAVSKREAVLEAGTAQIDRPSDGSSGGPGARVAMALNELREDRLAMVSIEVGLAGGLVMCLMAPFVANFLRSGLPVAFSLAASVPTIFTTGVVYGRLQGRQRFQLFATIALVVAGVKLGLGLGAVASGFGTSSVLLVVALATLLASVWGLIAVRSPGPSGLRPLSREIGRSLLVLVSWRAMIGMDVPLARYWLPDRLAGQYAAAAVIGRGILWLPEIVSFVLFPALASAVVTGVSVRAEMRKSLVLTVSLCAAGALALWAVGPTIFDLLYGSQYPRAADLAWKIALASVPTAAANLFMFAALARRDSAWIVMLVGAVAVQLFGLVLFHAAPVEFVVCTSLGGVLMLAITLWATMRPVIGLPSGATAARP